MRIIFGHHSVMGRPLDVMVISAYEVTRLGLTHLIHRDEHRALVTEAREADGSSEECDVVLYDTAPSLEPAALAAGGMREELLELVNRGTPVVAVAPIDHPELGERALALGAVAVVGPGVTDQQLLHVLEQSAVGQPLTTTATPLSKHRQSIRAAFKLTDGELDVLKMIGTGLSNQELAEELSLSINTVKTYIRTAYRKVGAKTRSQAVRWTIAVGLCAATDAS